MASQVYAGFVFNNAGVAVEGATVELFPRNTTTTATTSTTTNSSGYWTMSTSTEGRFDVRITNGTSVRFLKYDDEIQVTTLEVANLNIRNPADTFDYNILPAAIAADRTLTLPLLTGTDTLVTLGLAQTFTGALTFAGITLGGAVAGGDQAFTNVGDMTFAAGSILASGSTNGNTLLLRANDTTFITLTTGATDAMTIDAATASGTWLASGTWTLPAITLGGAITGGDQAFTAVGDMTFTSGSLLRSGSTNTNTLLIAANDTTFITLTTGATDVCTIDAVTASGTWLVSGTWTLPAFTAGGAIDFGNQNMTNVDIDSGAIDGAAIGAASATTIIGTTIDATTDFTVGGTIITDNTITDDGTFIVNAATLFHINAASADSDFTVEGNGNAFMIDVDAGLDSIGLGISGASDAFLTITSTFTAAASGAGSKLVNVAGVLTGGDTSTTLLAAVFVQANITTQTASENIATIAEVIFEEPAIIDNLTGDITRASVLLLDGLPTEGETNSGLIIDGGNRDGTYFTLASSDVAHAFTTGVSNADVAVDEFFSLQKSVGASGGVFMQAIAESTQSNAVFDFVAIGGAPSTTDTSGSAGTMQFIVGLNGNDNTFDDLATNANGWIWAEIIANGSRLTRMLLKADDGELHLGNTTIADLAADAEDDILALRAMRRETAGGGFVDSAWEANNPYRDYSRLREMGLVGERDEDGDFLFPLQKRIAFHEDTMWQMLCEMMDMAKALPKSVQKRLSRRMQSRLEAA